MSQISSILLIELLSIGFIFYSVLLCSIVYHCTSFVVKNKNKLFKQHTDIENQMFQLNDSEESLNSVDSNDDGKSIYYVKKNQKID